MALSRVFQRGCHLTVKILLPCSLEKPRDCCYITLYYIGVFGVYIARPTVVTKSAMMQNPPGLSARKTNGNRTNIQMEDASKENGTRWYQPG